MLDFLVPAFIAVAIAVWIWKRPLRRYNVRAGVLKNLEAIKSGLDVEGVSYSFEVPVDGEPDMTVDEGVAGGALARRHIRPEVILGVIKVKQNVGADVADKTVTVSGLTYPAPHITLALSPRHCWGFDPHALTAFNRDPRIGQVEFRLDTIRPNDLISQSLPEKAIDIAVRYLSSEVPQNLYQMHHESN